MCAFKEYHPIVNFIFFAFVIGFSMFFMHPVCLGISFVCGFAYLILLKGMRNAGKYLLFMLPVMVITALINPAFNHAGTTVLAYLPTGNPLTLESIIYGLCASAMLMSVLDWFSCYNRVMISDKFMYLFGNLIPALSLVISMVLRFVPKFLEQLKTVTKAQRCMGQDVTNGSIIERAKHGLHILSIMVTWSLENAVETADSMKSRGYGVAKRSAFSIYRFDEKDAKACLYIAVLGTYTLIGSLLGCVDFAYFPSVRSAEISALGASTFISYFALCATPVIIEIWEVRKWKALQSNM